MWQDKCRFPGVPLWVSASSVGGVTRVVPAPAKDTAVETMSQPSTLSRRSRSSRMKRTESYRSVDKPDVPCADRADDVQPQRLLSNKARSHVQKDSSSSATAPQPRSNSPVVVRQSSRRQPARTIVRAVAPSRGRTHKRNVVSQSTNSASAHASGFSTPVGRGHRDEGRRGRAQQTASSPESAVAAAMGSDKATSGWANGGRPAR